jgi:hypothetical protein
MEGNKVTIPKLLGQSNYEIWSLRMQSVLIEKGLGDFILSDYPNINLTEIEKKTIELNANRALALIRLSIADGPLLQIRNITTPLEAWNYLSNLYSPKGFSSEFILFKNLFSTTLSTSHDIEDYLNTIKRITDDLTSRNLKLPDKLIIA